MKGFEHSQIFMTFGTTELWKNPSLKKDFLGASKNIFIIKGITNIENI